MEGLVKFLNASGEEDAGVFIGNSQSLECVALLKVRIIINLPFITEVIARRPSYAITQAEFCPNRRG